jgi:peptidoglycan/xylan/chitin deacetylase (PgdA/CDA1 family)/folate-dependent phosphoribosylglycinamide formyltransferase PurN
VKVAFLVGGDSRSTRQSIEAVCTLPGIEPVGILVDTAVPSFRRRQKNLSRNIRANGWAYPVHRFLDALAETTGAAVETAAVSRAEVRGVLKKAFPDHCFSLVEVAAKFGMPLHFAGNLNESRAISILGASGAELGIVLGTRILKPAIFTVPAMGCINLHKGKVPEYRGMPPGFWELFDGASEAGVTVHFVDKGLDTGDVIATGTVTIGKTDTPDTLLEKLHMEGYAALRTAVAALRDRTAAPLPQEKSNRKPRSKPTLREESELARRLPHWRRRKGLPVIARNLYLLFVYYSGLYFLVRTLHKFSKSRAAIFLHHRVNDYAQDPLTVDPETFAAQLLAISKRYSFGSTAEIVECVRSRRPIKPTTVAIHFDDCYRDVFQNGAPILTTLGIPACAFINSGYIGTGRTFPHDAAKYPFQFEMLSAAEVQAWKNLGLEVGAHTVNHVDLGRIDVAEAEKEIVQCGQELQSITGQSVAFFSFPFGRRDNITPQTRNLVQTAGYDALFSAHGGFVGPETDPFDIPRGGANHEASPLYCLLQIEGLTLSQLGGKAQGY